MEPKDAVLATLASLPNHKIAGKKRFQKLLHLMQLAEAPFNLTFTISHFGAYSAELANAVDHLVHEDVVTENSEPVGAYGTYKSVYFPSQEVENWPTLSETHSKILARINDYSTVELEVASTIGFFRSTNYSLEDAIQFTRAMKPTKTIRPVLNKARTILSLVYQGQ